jgi:UDP-glucose 4-epimerase
MIERGLPVRGVTRQTGLGLVTIPSYGPEADWTEQLADVESIVHLAARVHVMRETSQDPLADFRVANVASTLNLARQAAQAGVRRFVFVSTIKVNGEKTEPGRPFKADDPPNPQDPYAISKGEAEAALLEFGKTTSMEIVIIRPPLVYGPGVGGNFQKLMRWASSGVPSFFADVKNKRSLVYVGNLCDLIIVTLSHSQAANGIFLVCDQQTFSTHELLLNLAATSGKHPLSIRLPSSVLKALAPLPLLGSAALARLINDLEVDATETERQLSWRCLYDGLISLQRTQSAYEARQMQPTSILNDRKGKLGRFR